MLFFTGGDDRLPYRQRTGLAVSSYPTDGDTDLPTWTMKSEPVTEAPAALPAGPGTAWAENFRDPFVWEEDGVWYQLTGSGIVDYDGTQVTKKYGGTALVHTARRPEGPWTYRGPLHWNDLTKVPEPGEVWELPVLLPLPGPTGKRTSKHILLVSPWWETFNSNAVKHTYYWIGTFDKDACRFVPDHEKPRKFDFGEHFTGPSGFVTPTAGPCSSASPRTAAANSSTPRPAGRTTPECPSASRSARTAPSASNRSAKRPPCGADDSPRFARPRCRTRTANSPTSRATC